MSVSVMLLIILAFSCLLLYVSTSFEQRQARLMTSFSLVIVIIMLSFVAYYLQPITGAYTDLERITNEVRMISNGQFSEIVQRYALNPLSAVYIAFASLCHNVNVLKFTSALIMFSCLLYIPYAEWRDHRISRFSFIFTTITTIAISNFPSYVFGVRQGPACTLAILAAYLCLVQKKHKSSIILLITAVLLHFSTIIIAGALLVAHIRKQRTYLIVCALIIGYTVISYVVVSMLSATGLSFASSLLGKMNGYYMFGSNFTMFASSLSQMCAYCRFFVSIMLLMLYLHLYREDNVKNQPYTRFFIVLLMVLVGSIPTGTPFRRFSMFALYASIPILGYVLTKFLRNPRSRSVSSQRISTKEQTRNRKSVLLHYMLFIVMLACIGVSVFYDWHSFIYYYLSSNQFYQV